MAHIITAVSGSDADAVPVKTALLSVSDKSGLVDLGKKLVSYGVTLLSTGGTAKALRDAGLPVTDVSEHTGSPEIMDGRVKTLHPKVRSALIGGQRGMLDNSTVQRRVHWITCGHNCNIVFICVGGSCVRHSTTRHLFRALDSGCDVAGRHRTLVVPVHVLLTTSSACLRSVHTHCPVTHRRSCIPSLVCADSRRPVGCARQ